ncbi:MAG: glycosyl hydrolase [Verrucomicrobia bacterium]|nr:glycosyl hydrolase [Verrucomicrobiota bacterium]
MNLPSLFRVCLGMSACLCGTISFPTNSHATSLTSTVASARFDRPMTPAVIADLRPQAASGQSRLVITINTKQEFHAIDGIGGAFNENGGEALTHLDQDQRQEVMKSLFDQATGAGFTFCRLPVGASDFALSAYSLNDHPDDFAMRHFTLERDEKFLIPYIKDALAINPKLRFHASPWSPPAWLKTNGSMTGGGRLRDTPEASKAYAAYLRRFVESYAQRGIRINRLFVQNEPNIEIKFPSCFMPPEQMVPFVVNHLAPEFSAHRIFTEIWAGTFQETKETLFAHSCFENERFGKAVHGAGFQYSDPIVIQDLQLLHPWLHVMHTEARCQDGDNSIAQAKALFSEIVQHFNARCTAFTYWNMVVNECQQSAWNWRQNSLITIDRGKKRVRYNPDYAVMALVSRYLRPGAKWLSSFSEPRRALATFRNPDKTMVALIWNEEDETLCDVIAGDGRTQVVLPAHALSAIRLKLASSKP